MEEGESRYRRLARKAANAFCAIIAFASAARALKAARYVNDINPEAIAEFLESGFLPDSCFVYEGAIKIPSASILKWCDAKVSTWQYWQPQPGLWSVRAAHIRQIERLSSGPRVIHSTRNIFESFLGKRRLCAPARKFHGG